MCIMHTCMFIARAQAAVEAEQAQLQKERAELRAQGEAERSHYYEQLRQDRAAAQLVRAELPTLPLTPT